MPTTNTRSGNCDQIMRPLIHRGSGCCRSVIEHDGKTRLTYSYEKNTLNNVTRYVAWIPTRDIPIQNEIGVLSVRTSRQGIRLKEDSAGFAQPTKNLACTGVESMSAGSQASSGVDVSASSASRRR